MDYPYIRAWEKMMGGSKSYLNDRLFQARLQNAPADATYYGESEWQTMSASSMHPNTRQRVEQLAEQYKGSAMTYLRYFRIVVPRDLHAQIKEYAANEKRTMQSVVLESLRRGFPAVMELPRRPIDNGNTT